MAVRDLKENEFFRNGEQICVTESVYKPSIEKHSHVFYEIAYITNGSGYHIVNGSENPISQGSLILITPGSVHNYSGDEKLRWINILFESSTVSRSLIHTDNADNIISSVLLTDYFQCNDNHDNNADMIVKEMLKEYKNASSGYQEILSAYLDVLLVIIFRSSVHSGHAPQALRESVISLIRKGEKISIETIAQRAFLSPRTFRSKFRKEVGETFNQFVRRCKIERACMLLKETDMTISAIMEEIQMNDTKNFFNTFKKYTGTTPNQYRK